MAPFEVCFKASLQTFSIQKSVHGKLLPQDKSLRPFRVWTFSKVLLFRINKVSAFPTRYLCLKRI